MKFGKSCEDVSWNHRTSTPDRSETNGIAQGAVRRVKEGKSAVLLQSGFDEAWWADSMEFCCHLRNVQDLLADGKHFFMKGLNSSARDQSRLHLWKESVEFGKGDILVADIDELEKMDASEIYPRRINAKEVLTPQKAYNFIFPIADGTFKLSGKTTYAENPL